MKLTTKQRDTLIWLGGACDTPFTVNPIVWSNLLEKRLVTERRSQLVVTKAGREALKAILNPKLVVYLKARPKGEGLAFSQHVREFKSVKAAVKFGRECFDRLDRMICDEWLNTLSREDYEYVVDAATVLVDDKAHAKIAQDAALMADSPYPPVKYPEAP